MDVLENVIRISSPSEGLWTVKREGSFPRVEADIIRDNIEVSVIDLLEGQKVFYELVCESGLDYNRKKVIHYILNSHNKIVNYAQCQRATFGISKE